MEISFFKCCFILEIKDITISLNYSIPDSLLYLFIINKYNTNTFKINNDILNKYS
jgi:hypothetical protein